MEDKYIHSGVAIKIPKGICATVRRLPTLQHYGLRNKTNGNIKGRQNIYFHLNQSYERKNLIVKNQTLGALIIMNKKAYKTLKMELNKHS